MKFNSSLIVDGKAFKVRNRFDSGRGGLDLYHFLHFLATVSLFRFRELLQPTNSPSPTRSTEATKREEEEGEEGEPPPPPSRPVAKNEKSERREERRGRAGTVASSSVMGGRQLIGHQGTMIGRTTTLAVAAASQTQSIDRSSNRRSSTLDANKFAHWDT